MDNGMKVIKQKGERRYNKTLVLGHGTSEYESVLELLKAGGMSGARPLRLQGMDPAEISRTLRDAYDFEGGETGQVEVDRVWDGLVLDLLISNKGEKWWGWADSEALPFLDYFKSLDSTMGFVLVYDTPQEFIKKYLVGSKDISPDRLKEAVGEWCSYNRAMLEFFMRNSDHAMLVNTQQVKLRTDEYLKKTARRIGFDSSDIDSGAVVALKDTFGKEERDPLHSYLSENIVSAFPEAVSLFEEMQSVANLPYEMDEGEKGEYDAMEALISLQRRDRMLEALEEKGQLKARLKSESEKFKKLIEDEKKKAAALQKERDTLSEELKRVKANEQKLAEAEKERSRENEELLSQLMLVQEELEKYYLRNQELQELERGMSEENEKLTSQIDVLEKELRKLFFENLRLKEKIEG